MTDINGSVSVLNSVLVGEKSMNWLTRNLNLADDLILLMFNKTNGSDFLPFFGTSNIFTICKLYYFPFCFVFNRFFFIFLRFL